MNIKYMLTLQLDPECNKSLLEAIDALVDALIDRVYISNARGEDVIGRSEALHELSGTLGEVFNVYEIERTILPFDSE